MEQLRAELSHLLGEKLSRIECVMRFITCRTPDGSLVPAILSPDGNTVWPLRWLGLPADEGQSGVVWS